MFFHVKDKSDFINEEIQMASYLVLMREGVRDFESTLAKNPSFTSAMIKVGQWASDGKIELTDQEQNFLRKVAVSGGFPVLGAAIGRWSRPLRSDKLISRFAKSYFDWAKKNRKTVEDGGGLEEFFVKKVVNDFNDKEDVVTIFKQTYHNIKTGKDASDDYNQNKMEKTLSDFSWVQEAAKNTNENAPEGLQSRILQKIQSGLNKDKVSVLSFVGFIRKYINSVELLGALASSENKNYISSESHKIKGGSIKGLKLRYLDTLIDKIEELGINKYPADRPQKNKENTFSEVNK